MRLVKLDMTLGQDGSTWDFVKCRGDYEITGKSIMIGRNQNPISYFESGTISGGIGKLNFNYMQAFGTNVNLKVFIVQNSTETEVANVTSSGEQEVIKASGDIDINVGGDFKLKFINAVTSAGQVCVDDIEWTGYATSAPSIDILTKNLDPFTYVLNVGPSASQTVKVGVTNFTTGDVLNVSSSMNYEIKKALSMGNYGSSVSFNLDGSPQTFEVDVRLIQGLEVGDHLGTLTFSVGSGDDKVEEILDLTGEVTAPPIVAPVANAATNISHDSFTANWEASTGATEYFIDVYERVVGTASDLIISEYIEGSGNNKFIEIYNGTGSSVDLSDYRLQLYANGASSPTNNVLLSGTLEHNECIVYKNSGASLTPPAGVTAIDNTATNFNGDDAIALYKISTDSFVDIFGVIGNDPGTEWTGEGGYSTLDKTLVRKPHVLQGVSVRPTGTGPSAFTTLTTEWDVFPIDTVSNLGSHVMNFGLAPSYHLENQSAGSNLSYIVTGLDAAKNYFYVVRAADSYGQISENSNEIAVTTLPAPVYDYPENTEVTLPFGGSLTFTAGNASNSAASMPDLPNSNIDPSDYESLALELAGSGPWAIELASGLGFCAYNWQNNWHDAGQIAGGFKINVDSGAKGDKDLFIVLSNQNPTLPVELSAFMVVLNSNGNPVVTWETQSETGVNGFYIYRGVNKSLSEAALISSLIPATNSSLAHSYSFIDRDLSEEGVYYYWLNVSDLNGQESYHGPAELNVILNEEETTPEVANVTALKGIYPNPFNPSANIGFELAEASEVKISVYNTRGQLVRSFAPFTHDAGQGSIVWDGKDEGGNSVSSGIYLFRMTVGAKSYSAKALMMK